MEFPFEMGLHGSQVSKARPPNFLYVVLDRTACAPFYTERNIECPEPTRLRRKSGTWGTLLFFPMFFPILSEFSLGGGRQGQRFPGLLRQFVVDQAAS